MKGIFPAATAFFCVFEEHDFHHTFSLPSLLFTSSPLFSSLLFSSPLRGLPLSLLWSFLLCLVLLSFFFSVLCHCFCCCCVVAAASAVAARVAAVAGALLLCCCWSSSLLVLLVWSCVFLSGCFSFRVGFSFCPFSLSFRPLLSSCQVHSAPRVACSRAGHHDDG